MEKGDEFSCEKVIIRNTWVRRSWEKEQLRIMAWVELWRTSQDKNSEFDMGVKDLEGIGMVECGQYI